MNKPKHKPKPEEIFTAAIRDEKGDLTKGDLNLLVSGLTALREVANKPLNDREQKSINSLIAYKSNEQNVDDSFIEAVLLAEYNVPSISKITSNDYQDVVEYLVDLKVEMILN